MARPIDPLKMERLKEAVIEMIVEYGYKGVDIKGLSKRTGISAGYLYKYYSNKEELIINTTRLYADEIINEILDPSIKESNDLKEFIIVLNNYLYDTLEESLTTIRFFIKIFFDPTLREVKNTLKKDMSLFSGFNNILQEDNELDYQQTLNKICSISFTFVNLKIEYEEMYKKKYYLSREEIIDKVYEMSLIALK